MQRKALKELARCRQLGEKRALVVASTGSGKTYLAAFDAKNCDAHRLLFVVHRDTILLEAMQTFKNVFHSSRTYGLFTGNESNLSAQFIFASNIMISEHLDYFEKNEFDYIIIDECHHAAATTYSKIINYFNPAFLLGLTATPERMDNQDVFSMFGNNVPYELRLRDAIVNDLVVPFHYFGIRDTFVDYSDKAKGQFLASAYCDGHAEFIAEQIELHRPKEGKLKALAFCRDVEHATMMAGKMNSLGYCCKRLIGKNDTGERMLAYKELQDDDSDLEIIFTVDILNEGVDIPAINMVLFLRPTQSQTIFIQQLGRGLRKYENKEFLTVLDFIGNSYDRSIQVALALGELSPSSYVEKPLLTSLVRNNFKEIDIPGVEINFDSYSQDEILKYIERTNFNSLKFLKQDYFLFKKYLDNGTYPKHLDYLYSDCAPDLIKLMKSKIKNKKNRSYYNFLKAMEEDNLPVLNEEEIEIVNRLSEMLPLVRKEEYLIVKSIIQDVHTYNYFLEFKKISARISDTSIKSALDNLVYQKIIVLENGEYKFNVKDTSIDFNDYTLDLLDYGLERYDREFGDFDTKFKLYGNYQKSQIIMEIEGVQTMFVKGTKFKNDEVYLFVGLQKDKRNVVNFNYKDMFLSPEIFQWESENNTTLKNATGQKLLHAKCVHLFIRKLEEEDGITLPFTYFGTGKFSDNVVAEKNNGQDTLLFKIILDNIVPKELRYDFLVPEPVTD